MAQWKIDKNILEANLTDDSLEFSSIKDDLEDFSDRETGMFKIKKMLNLSTVFNIYIDKTTFRIVYFTISITSLFDSNVYKLSFEDFKKVITEIDDQDASNTVECLKNYFAGRDELTFINMLDELNIQKE